MSLVDEVGRYYQQSDNELAQRYIKDRDFLSPDYCRAALQHRYALYPFIDEIVDFPRWTGKRVLEIGCGQGADLSRFVASGAQAYGCDLTPKHCQISRDFVAALGGEVATAQADARQLPYASESFDLVYSFGVLLLVEDLDAGIREIHRVLKPGGRVIVMFYNRQSLHYYVKTLFYYGVVCDLERILGPRRLVDWFTDGFGYPRTFHQSPDSLRKAFGRFTVENVWVRNLTPDQVPRCQFDDYPQDFWKWIASALGFYVMLSGRK